MRGAEVIAFFGLLLMHVVGASIRALVLGEPWHQTLRAPSSAWFGVVTLYGASLGFVGLAAVLALMAALRIARTKSQSSQGSKLQETPSRGFWWFVAGFAVVTLARPWVAIYWDELVWLAKARVETLGFGTGAHLALDPDARLLPMGYPPLWPSTVSWLTLQHDALEAQVVGAALIMVLCAASAAEAWWHSLRSTAVATIVAVLATPLIWVHARSAYLDLPVGLLGLAVLGHLLSGRIAVATVMAVVACGFKDEGLAHVLAAALAGWLASSPRSPRMAVPALAGIATAALWRALAAWHGVINVDHALSWPVWRSLPTLATSFALHATDFFSWGVFWAVAAAVLVTPSGSPQSAKALRWALAVNMLLSFAALASGSEQVRAFAENGTLLNRLLVQWWPLAAALVMVSLSHRAGEAATARPPR